MKSRKRIFTMLVLMLALCITSCAKDEAREAGDSIVEKTIEGKVKKIEKDLDKDDDDYDAQCNMVNSIYTISFNKDFVFEDLDYEIKKADVKISGDDAFISYELDIESEDYGYSLNLTKDDDKWVIADNREYLINTLALWFEVLLEEGDSLTKDNIEDWMDEGDYDDFYELAEDKYDEMIDRYYARDIDAEVDDDIDDIDDIDVDDPYAYDSDVVDMTMFIGFPGQEINDGNFAQEIIAEKTGVRVKETFLVGQTPELALGTIIAAGDYPDYLYFDNELYMAYEADILVAWDDYIDMYPNIKELYTDEEWDMLRQSDGHIYWAPVLDNTYGESKETIHNDGAFWIQTRVLEEAGYPNISTVDEYFELLEQYASNHPTMGNGDDIIPFTILCEDWRNFCLLNPPMLLSGYPDEGFIAVDDSGAAPVIYDYNLSDVAKDYYRQLNKAYNSGLLDPDFAIQTYDEYIAKLSTGGVLGMYDQYWDFNYTVSYIFARDDYYYGCNYVPLALTAEEGMDNKYHTYYDSFNWGGGIAVTTNCEDPDLAFSFINDLLTQEMHDIRFWGIEDINYMVDADGYYYRTDDMRSNAADPIYQAENLCSYSYFPQWVGTSRDGINAMVPSEQASEFLATLPEDTANCLMAYGCDNYVDMLGSVEERPGEWYPMYSYTNSMSTDTPGGVALYKMKEVQAEDIPKAIMAKDFDSAWNTYVNDYNACKPEDFYEEAQEELDIRCGN